MLVEKARSVSSTRDVKAEAVKNRALAPCGNRPDVAPSSRFKSTTAVALTPSSAAVCAFAAQQLRTLSHSCHGRTGVKAWMIRLSLQHFGGNLRESSGH